MTAIARRNRNEASSIPSEPGLSAENVWHVADRTTALRKGITSILGKTDLRNERATVPTTDAEALVGAYAFLQEPRSGLRVICDPRTQSSEGLDENWENAAERFAVWVFHAGTVDKDAAWVASLPERAKKTRAEFAALLRHKLVAEVSVGEPQDVVDWDFRIEPPPARPSREIRMHFVQRPKQAPPIKDNPEE